MKLQKTDKARAELQPGSRTLGQRERSLLLLADGHKTAHEVGSHLGESGERLVLQLVRDGYLSQVTPPALPPAAPRVVRPVVLSVVPRPAPAPPSPAPASAPFAPTVAEEPVLRQVSADAFDGKRSLATTRMFLFDICERMFARRSPVLAESFREALRNARDRESMLEVGREMMVEVENVAGAERAESIRERISLLLPVELVA